MLYVFYGTDTPAVREKAFTRLHEEKAVDTVALTSDAYNAGGLTEYLGAQSLFGDQQSVVIDTPEEGSDLFRDICEHAQACAASSSVFVLILGTLRAPEKKKLTTAATEMHEQQLAKTDTFTPFALTDALLRKDKKSLWILFTRARTHKLSGEELIGVLFWQVKTVRLCARAGSANAAGVKPFVYTKATQALTKYTREDFDRYSRDLLTIYHDAHRGTRDIMIALERWILSL